MITFILRKYGKQFFTLKPTRTADSSTFLSVLISFGIAATQLGDYLSTKLGLTIAGATEANGTMAKFIARYGYDAFLGLKMAAVAFLIWSCWKRPAFGMGIILLYTLVIVNNLSVILRLHG